MKLLYPQLNGMRIIGFQFVDGFCRCIKCICKPVLTSCPSRPFDRYTSCFAIRVIHETTMNLSPTCSAGNRFTSCIMLQRLHFTPCLIREIRLVGSLYDNAVSFPYDIRQRPFATGVTDGGGNCPDADGHDQREGRDRRTLCPVAVYILLKAAPKASTASLF